MKIKGTKWTSPKICGCSCTHCAHAIQVPRLLLVANFIYHPLDQIREHIAEKEKLLHAKYVIYPSKKIFIQYMVMSHIIEQNIMISHQNLWIKKNFSVQNVLKFISANLILKFMLENIRKKKLKNIYVKNVMWQFLVEKIMFHIAKKFIMKLRQ